MDPSRAALRYQGEPLEAGLLEVVHELLRRPGLPRADAWVRGFAIEVLDHGPVRAVVRVQRTGVVLKLFAPRGWAERVRAHVRASRAAHEYALLQQAAAHGLPVPRGLGHARLRGGDPRRAALLLADLGPGRSLAAAPLDEGLCARAGALLARARAAGLAHADLHLGNLFEDARGELHLLDLHRARWRHGARYRVAELWPLFLSLPWPEQSLLREALFAPLGVPATPAGLAARLQAHLRRRLVRCRRASGPFVVARDFRQRRGAELERPLAAWRAEFDGATVIKRGRRGAVLRAASGLYAKERDLRHARALWEAAFALELRAIAAPRARALVPLAGGRALVVSPALEDERGLDRCWAERGFAAVRVAARLGHDYARLHATGWRCRDGRGDNVVVRAGEEPAFVDLDGVRPGASAGGRVAAQDLGRLLAWLRFEAPARDDAAACARAFLRHYLRTARAHGQPVRGLRRFGARIARRCARWAREHGREPR